MTRPARTRRSRAQTHPQWQATHRQLQRRVHALARQKGLDKDTRRKLQRRLTGVDSTKFMSNGQLRLVVNALEGGGSDGVKVRSPEEKKAVALWLSCYWCGLVENRTDAALERFCLRQTALRRSEMAGQWPAVVEALKDMLAHGMGVNWARHKSDVEPGNPNRCPQIAVMLAQWRYLARFGRVEIGNHKTLAQYAARVLRLPDLIALDEMNAEGKIEIIKHLGGIIRSINESAGAAHGGDSA